jgi:hypothetical protein
MRALRCLSVVILTVPLVALGCTKSDSPAPDTETKIKQAMEQLDPADRALAQEQRYCAVQTDHRLGTMGKPVKVMIKDQPVFLCCKACIESAKEDEDKTLERVKQLKSTDEDAAAKEPPKKR